ncbi:MAG TPA: sensor domain-containing diguanylate cyclase [Methylophilaceae bacterium]|jgi:diguanylate cyclase (GGDEF)-like protein/PAS domain S-box-containing protein
MSIWLYLGLVIAFIAIVVVSVFAYRFAKLSQQLQASEERWKFALEGAGDGVWDWDVKADDVVFSPRYCEMYGFSDEDVTLKSKQWQERIHPDDRERVRIDVQAYLNGETDHYVNEHQVICKDGSIKWALSRGMIVSRDEDGKPVRMIGTHADITERKNIEQKIRLMAHYDSLTELPNRILIDDRLKQALAHARRENKSLALMFLDLDKFKPVNDTLGHDIGDALLKQVAKRLQLSVRASDTVARIGGDEFIVLLPTIDETEDAVIVAEKILEALNQPFEIASHKLNISSSIGIALFPQHAADEHSLLVNADTAMYHSKNAGRNNVKLYSEQMKKNS